MKNQNRLKTNLLEIASRNHFAKPAAAFFCALAFSSLFAKASDPSANRHLADAPRASFRLFSDDIQNGARLPEAQVFNRNGYRGENLSPQLAWSGAPAGTKSFVITLFDPDAPTGHGWWHWAVIDIPASVSELSRGAGSGMKSPPNLLPPLLPKGARQLRNDFGESHYDGAAPPPGKAHHYIFTIYALNVAKLGVDADPSAVQIPKILRGKILGKASLTAIYGKP